jgi:hypothetical protein
MENAAPERATLAPTDVSMATSALPGHHRPDIQWANICPNEWCGLAIGHFDMFT